MESSPRPLAAAPSPPSERLARLARGKRAPLRPNVLTLLGLAACSFWGVSQSLPAALAAVGVREKIPAIVELAGVHLLGLGSVLGMMVLWSDLPVRVLFTLGRFRIRILWALTAGMAGISILGSEAANWIVRSGGVGEAARASVPVALDPLDWILTVSVVAGVVPWTEELLFRGLVLDGLVARVGTGLGVLASAILFALFHLDPLQMPLALAAGMLLAIVRLRTGSVLPCVLGHAVLNAFPFLVTWLIGSIPGYGFEPTASLRQPALFNALGAVLLSVGVVGVIQEKRAFASCGSRGARPH